MMAKLRRSGTKSFLANLAKSDFVILSIPAKTSSGVSVLPKMSSLTPKKEFTFFVSSRERARCPLIYSLALLSSVS